MLDLILTTFTCICDYFVSTEPIPLIRTDTTSNAETNLRISLNASLHRIASPVYTNILNLNRLVSVRRFVVNSFPWQQNAKQISVI
jgi:hypothetical protein